MAKVKPAKPLITKEQEQSSVELFYDLLPHYWDQAEELPLEAKLALGLNRWHTIMEACTWIADNVPTPKTSRKLRAELVKEQCFGQMRHMPVKRLWELDAEMNSEHN